MRKILAICLVAILILSTSALSVSAIQPGGSSGADVYIKYDETEMSRYSIDIVFGDMTFVYDVYSVWDTEKHEYVITENGREILNKELQRLSELLENGKRLLGGSEQ